MDTKDTVYNIRQYPVLQSLLWDRATKTVISGQSAFDLYEIRSGYYCVSDFTKTERKFFNFLIKKYGKGVCLNRKDKHDRHIMIYDILKNINVELLNEYSIYLTGGIAINLLCNKFRDTKDINLLCSNNIQFTRFRNMVQEGGITELFLNSCILLRDESRIDQHTVRNAIVYNDEIIKFEIAYDPRIKITDKCQYMMDIPALTTRDLITTKLYASFDRTCSRDNLSKDILDLCVMYRIFPCEFESIIESTDILWRYCLDAYMKNICLLYEKNYLKFVATELRLDIPHIEYCIAKFKQWIRHKSEPADCHILSMRQ